MRIERHRFAQVIVDVELLIKRNPIKGKGRSTSGLLVILAHGETATAKDRKENYNKQTKRNMRHQKENSNQSTSYDEKRDNANNKGERRMNRGDA